MKTYLLALLITPAVLLAQSLAPLNADGVAVGALAPSAITKGPKAAFDLTGTWLHGGGANNPWQFAPPAGAKLKPPAAKEYDAYKTAQAQGKAYKDDIGQCWPAGLPIIMTRVWPI